MKDCKDENFFTPMMLRPEIGVFVRSVLDGCDVPGDFFELGVGRAGSSTFLVRFLHLVGQGDRRVRSIDVSQTAEKCWHRRAAPHAKGRDVAFVLGRTTEVARHLDPRDLAWLLIDACHCRPCVRDDVAAWAGRIRPGGILVFHDSAPTYREKLVCSETNQETTVGVSDAIEDMREYMAPFDLVRAEDREGLCGIREYRRRA